MNFKKDSEPCNIVVCGSVDDGKSTLIGRLIHDTNNLYKDQISNLKNDTKKYSNLKIN